MNHPAPIRILFVCLGNICRSPSGENVLRHIVEKEGLSDHFEIDSAGTIDFHQGNPPDSRMMEAARKRGIAMEGNARQVKPHDFSKYDIILAMDRNNYQDLVAVSERCPDINAKLEMFCDYCEQYDESEVPDPYYGSESGFSKVLDLLEDGCVSIVEQWKRGELG